MVCPQSDPGQPVEQLVFWASLRLCIPAVCYCDPRCAAVGFCQDPWYVQEMKQSYVGLVSRRGLESCLPDDDVALGFLLRRAYGLRPTRAVCYWALLEDEAQGDIVRLLDAGEPAAAFAALQALAVSLGTIPPPGRDHLIPHADTRLCGA